MVHIPTIKELREAKAEVLAQSEPLRKKRDEVTAKRQELEKYERELTAQINVIEQPALGELQTLLNPLEAKEARIAARARAATGGAEPAA